MRKEPIFYAEECYCKKIRFAASQVTWLYDQHLKKEGVTSKQFSVLECIRSMEPVSVTKLSQTLGLDRTSLSRKLKVLKKNGMIEDLEERGKSRQIILSKQGNRILLKAEENWEKAQAEFQSLFETEQLEQLQKLIDKISINRSR